MRAHEAIADALSTWRPIQSAADIAHEISGLLSADERDRLVLRALTEEVRANLRRKDSSGVPMYANVDRLDPATGRTVKVYKQTAMFDEKDYRVAVHSYRRRSLENAAVAESLRSQCLQRFGVDPLPYEAIA